MLNIILTLTAAPELLAAISNLTSVLGCKNIVNVKGDGSEFTASKVQAEHNFQQAGVVQNTKTITVPVSTQGVKTEQYIQTVLPISFPETSMKQDGFLSMQPQNQVQADTIQTNASVVPTSVQTYTMEQLAVAATQLVDAGRRTELVNLLNSFGVQALTALPKDQYGAFATQLRALGAKL